MLRFLGHYSMAKAAVLSMTKTAALEYVSDRIRINAVCPTAVETEIVQQFINSQPDPEAARNGMVKFNPMVEAMGEICQLSDVTGVVSFLAGPDARFVNGQSIAIDGGYSIQ